MDRIYINGLEVFARHGVYPEERALGQKFVVSLTLYTDTRPAGRTDALEQTVDYAAAAKKAVQAMQESEYLLLERAAEETARKLLTAYPQLCGVTVRIDKPWAPLGLPVETAGVEITRKWHEAFLGLGSNLGDRENYLSEAVRGLSGNPDIAVEAVSDWIETKPVGMTDQPDFLNGCVQIRTLLTPEELLDTALALENQAGRKRLVHWGPRTLDIDLLFYDQEIIGTERLQVPHPEAEKREFVLRPMVQLAPWFRHPVSHKTVKQLLEELVSAKAVPDRETDKKADKKEKEAGGKTKQAEKKTKKPEKGKKKEFADYVGLKRGKKKN